MENFTYLKWYSFFSAATASIMLPVALAIANEYELHTNDRSNVNGSFCEIFQNEL
jgi:hypothetical protein